MMTSSNDLKAVKEKSRSPRGNYHVHTTLSDGSDNPEKVVQLAINAGLDEIGICDHFFTTKGSIRSVEDVARYVKEIEAVKDAFQGQIRVLAGLEIDTSYHNPRRFDLPFQELDKLDFVLFEYVESRELKSNCPDQKVQAVFSLDDLIQARSRLSCQVGLAHPDIPGDFTSIEPERLALLLKQNDIYVDACFSKRHGVTRHFELDGQEYPIAPFFAMDGQYKEAFIRHKVGFSPSTDHHHGNDIGNALYAWSILDSIGFDVKKFSYKGGLQPLVGKLGAVYSAIEQVPEDLIGSESIDAVSRLKAICRTILGYQKVQIPNDEKDDAYTAFNNHLEQAKKDIVSAAVSTEMAAAFGDIFRADKKGPIRVKLLSGIDNLEIAVSNPAYALVESYHS